MKRNFRGSCWNLAQCPANRHVMVQRVVVIIMSGWGKKAAESKYKMREVYSLSHAVVSSRLDKEAACLKLALLRWGYEMQSPQCQTLLMKQTAKHPAILPTDHIILIHMNVVRSVRIKEFGISPSYRLQDFQGKKRCAFFSFLQVSWFTMKFHFKKQASKQTKSPPNPTRMLCLHQSTEIVLAESEYKSKNFF